MQNYESETKAIIGARNIATIAQETAYVFQRRDMWTGETVYRVSTSPTGLDVLHAVEPLDAKYRLSAIADMHGAGFEMIPDGSIVVDGVTCYSDRQLLNVLGY